MNIDGWKNFYKYNHEGRLCTTNLMYSPYVNPEGNILCMSWDEKDLYQVENKNLSKQLVDYFFEREVDNLLRLQKYDWAAQVKEIDMSKQRIFIEWNTDSINTLLYKGIDLDIVCPTWKEQIYNILVDLKNEQLYKMALYPHCFFLDKNNNIKTFDFYSCVPMNNPYISLSIVSGLIGNDSIDRFKSATVGDNIDFSVFFANTLKTHLGKYWNNNPFPEFYTRLYGDNNGS